MTDAELRALLLDCLRLWETPGSVLVRDTDVLIETSDAMVWVSRATEDVRPVRWFYQTEERATAGRPPRAAPSIVALLAALRNLLGGTGGSRLRVGG